MKLFIAAALIAVVAANSAYPAYPTYPSYPAPVYPAKTYAAPVYPAKAYPAPAYPAPAYPEKAYPAPAYPEKAYVAPAYPEKAYSAPKYDHPPMPYNFAWAVEDAPSYNSYGQQETSDGKVVSGSYRVALPDGRTQTVNYKVDGYSGYVADVKYDGVAKYPEYSAPAYKAAYPAKY